MCSHVQTHTQKKLFSHTCLSVRLAGRVNEPLRRVWRVKLPSDRRARRASCGGSFLSCFRKLRAGLSLLVECISGCIRRRTFVSVRAAVVVWQIIWVLWATLTLVVAATVDLIWWVIKMIAIRAADWLGNKVIRQVWSGHSHREVQIEWHSLEPGAGDPPGIFPHSGRNRCAGWPYTYDRHCCLSLGRTRSHCARQCACVNQ